MKENFEIEHANQFAEPSQVNNGDAKQLLHELNVAFEQFKDANDDRLLQLEKKQSEDVVTSDKVNRLNDRITKINCDLRKPKLSGQVHETDYEEKAAFANFLKSGHVGQNFNTLNSDVETRALTSNTDADGGYFVPKTIDARISNQPASSSLKSLASYVQISVGNAYRQLIPSSEFGSSWVSETGSRPQTTDSNLTELSIPVHEIYANPAATTALLEDSAVDVEKWFVETINRSFHEKESASFVSGTGRNQPKGVLSYSFHTGTSAVWNQIMYRKSGNSAGFLSINPHLRLIDTIYHLKPVYRQNSHWLMNQNTMAKIRKMRDEDKQHIWTPPSGIDQLPRVLGYPVLEESNMPEVRGGNFPIIFGDFKAGYMVVERVGTQVLRDPYSAKPYVLFYTTRRVGGGVQNFNAFCAFKAST